MKLKDLKPNDKNPRKISESALEKLKQSIERDPEFMVLRPIVIDDDGLILGGNQRYRAIKAMGMKDIPDNWVVKADNLTEEQRKRFILVDNAPDGMAGEWDWETLKDSFPEFELADLGFTFEPVEFEPEIEIMDANGKLDGGNYGDVSSNGIPINIMGIGGLCDRDIVIKARQRLIEMGANDESDNGAIINEMFKGWIEK